MEDSGLARLTAGPGLPAGRGSPFNAPAALGHLGSRIRLGSATATDYSDILNRRLFGGLGLIGIGAVLWFLGINGIEVRKSPGAFHGQPPHFALQVGFGRVAEGLDAVMVAAAYLGAWYRYQTAREWPEATQSGLVEWFVSLVLAVVLTALNVLGNCTTPPGG
jgi:hypothetical protein